MMDPRVMTNRTGVKGIIPNHIIPALHGLAQQLENNDISLSAFVWGRIKSLLYQSIAALSQFMVCIEAVQS